MRAGERALRVTLPRRSAALGAGRRAGRDWRGHPVLALDLTNPGDGTPVHVAHPRRRAHLENRDRLNLPGAIPPRTRVTVRVALAAVESAPPARRMDMARIANVMLFGQRVDGAGEFYVSRVWLE